MSTSSVNLLSPVSYGAIDAKNRIVMAPLTRTRATADWLASDLMAEYYAQRASVGMIISECMMVLPQTAAFAPITGLYGDAQIEAWKPVTRAVHAAGGKMVAQLWHAGRAAHPDLTNGEWPVAPSAIAIDGTTHTQNGKVPYVQPKALEKKEIAEIVTAFAQAAKNARTAGFDGIEIHGANGYLIDEFLRDSSNQRTDEYGGSIANRARLLLEIIEACCDAIGADRTGLRLSPVTRVNSMQDSDPAALSLWLAKNLSPLNLAFLEVMRGDMTGQDPLLVDQIFRDHYSGKLILNLGFTPEEANAAIEHNLCDAVSFGRLAIANPDLPARIAQNAPLNEPDPKTFYGGQQGATGYTDYPTL